MRALREVTDIEHAGMVRPPDSTGNPTG